MIIRNLLVSIGLVGMSHVAGADTSALVTAPVDRIFVPSGFDDNDKVEVIIHGEFSSSCYKMGPVSATVDDATKKISISAQAYFYRGVSCIQLLTPFIKSVEIDRHLLSGDYTISVVDRPTAGAPKLHVTRSTRPDADDFLYAAATFADIEVGVDGSRELVLKGQHPYLLDGCVKFDAVRTAVGADGTIVVLPVTKIVYGDECRGYVNNRFEYRTKFGDTLPVGEYLLHVRVLDGNSVNQFLDFR
jgi:hypothetical protein